MAGTLFRLTGIRRGLRISCCIVGIVSLRPIVPAGGARVIQSVGKSPYNPKPKCGTGPFTFGLSAQRTSEDLRLQDHDPDVIPVSPAASNPRPKAT